MSEIQVLRYTYRLRPGAIAVRRLELDSRLSRYVWNMCVELGKNAYIRFKESGEKTTVSLCTLSKELTKLRKDNDWLREGSQVVQQQTIRKFITAYQGAFKGKGFPKFKSSKRDLPSLEYTLRGFSIKDGKLNLAGKINIPVVWSRELPSDPKSCVVYRDSVGDWFVSFVTRRDSPGLPPSNKGIGIDWGVKDIATTDNDGFDLASEPSMEKEIAIANRKLSRCKTGSNGHKKAKKELARKHRKQARIRKDRAHKWSKSIVDAFGYIAIEDFKSKFLGKTRMAKKAAHNAVGITKQILISKSVGRTVSLVDPAYTTQTCFSCGVRTKHALNQRTFVCSSCGHTDGRDKNAARNILAKAGFDLANVDPVIAGLHSCKLALVS